MGGRDDDKRNDFDRLMAQVGTDLADTKAELDRMVDDLRRQLPHSQLEERYGDHEQNSSPFQRFKSFVDSNVALLSDGFKNFPGNIKELKQRMQAEREARREEELDIWRRWTGSNDSPDHIQMQVERASRDDKKSVTAATFMLLRESFERNRHVPAQKILDLYRDDEWSSGALDQFATPMLSFGGACYYKSETVENLPSTARWGWPASSQKWLSVDWFKRSQYSPLCLEAHPDLSWHGEKWRAAFEDLLLVSLDKPMQTSEKIGQRIPSGKPQSTYHGPGLDWMLSLQCRGILPPQLPNLYRHYRNEDGREFFKPAHTRVLPDLDAITSQRPHCMYPRAEADLHALMNEVGIPAQPETDAYSLPQRAGIPQSPWQVPDTEAELYEQMQPACPAASRYDYDMDDEVYDGKLEDRVHAALVEGDLMLAMEHLLGFDLHPGYEQLLRDAAFFIPTNQGNDLVDIIQDLDHDPDLQRVGEGLLEHMRLHWRWQNLHDRADQLGQADLMEQARADGAPLEKLENELRAYANARARGDREDRIERALERAEKLGYDFGDWEWENLPLEELEGELDREEAYTTARRRAVLAKAAKLGYDFNGWEYQGLPVQELEDEMLRMEEYARRDAEAPSYALAGNDVETKRPDVLSQLTTTETVRLSDGTVTTKVVLKRRFADGREETKESVHTFNEQTQAQQTVLNEAEKSEKKNGWFWT